MFIDHISDHADRFLENESNSNKLLARVDQAFGQTRVKTQRNLKVLSKTMRRNLDLFDNELLDLDQMVQLELTEEEPDSIAQIRALQEDQMAKRMQDQKDEALKLKKLREKFGIVVEYDKELAFKDLMMLKCP